MEFVRQLLTLHPAHFMFQCEKYCAYRKTVIEVFKKSNIILSDCNRGNLVILFITNYKNNNSEGHLEIYI